MVNLTPNSVVFNLDGPELTVRVRAALKLAADTHLRLARLQDVDLESVTTKTNIRAAFAKFINGRVLRDPERPFNKDYVECALEAYEANPGHISKILFDTLLTADEDGPYSYKLSYAKHIKTGLGLFLVALHSSGAVTLCSTFSWPIMRENDGRRLEVGKYVASELLSFIRTLNSQSETLPHKAFEVIGGDRKRREWFLTYGTKLLLVLGWHKPEDANVADLLKIKSANQETNVKSAVPLAYLALLDVLNLAYPGRINLTREAWTEALKLNRSTSVKLNGQRASVSQALQTLFENGPSKDHDHLEDVRHLDAVWGKPDRIRSLVRLPGLDIDIAAISKLWLELEDLYVSKVARESYKNFYNSIGWWNVYLFYYLPYWFAKNAAGTWVFPASPALLIKSVFVSRLLPTKEVTPMTFIEFMNLQAELRGWSSNSYYSYILQLQTFFVFVERFSEEIPGCEGFSQPLGPHDFPRISRPIHTNKQPVPRRFFGVYMDYHEALLAHHTVVLNRVIAGELSADDLKILEANGNVIDTFKTIKLVGFIPLIFTATKTIALQFIPNVLDTRYRTVRDGRKLRLPHPHALRQSLVALHTRTI